MQTRKSRGTHRKRDYETTKDNADNVGLSFLELKRVEAKTATAYCKEVGDFQAWSCLNQVRTSSPLLLDKALLEYLDYCFFEGYNHDRGDRLISSITFLLPDAHRGGKWEPVRAKAALRGFRRLAPGRSRAPLPWLGAAAMIGCALHLGLREFAFALLISWAGHLRLPSDLLAMNANTLIPPNRFGDSKHWGLLLYAEEGGKTSKAGLMDEGLMLDHPQLMQVSPLLRKIVRDRKGAVTLWTFTEGEFRKMWTKCAEGAGLPQQEVNPYQFRHGSASHDIWAKNRTLEEMQQRLRHASLSSTKRYEKQTRYLAELNKLPTQVSNYGHHLVTNMAQFFLQKAPPPAPPGIKQHVCRRVRGKGTPLHRRKL